jgi:transcriptional regulator with XRE-family HTH domain
MAKQPVKTESLGDKIHKMRKKLKLDLDEVAQKAGCSPEQLKQIEEGKASPPVGMLIQISRALSVDSASLLADERKAERHRSYRKRTQAYAYESLTPDAQDKHIWAYLVTLEPKKAHEMVEYQHEGEEFVYVLDGWVEIQVGAETHMIKKGGHLHFNSGLKHNLQNLSSKQSKLLVVVYTP